MAFQPYEVLVREVPTVTNASKQVRAQGYDIISIA